MSAAPASEASSTGTAARFRSSSSSMPTTPPQTPMAHAATAQAGTLSKYASCSGVTAFR